MADIRGYRFYRQRYFRQAQAWFEVAVRSDPTFEPSLRNAARVAALLGEPQRAQNLLHRLGRLNTPLSRSLLRIVSQDPDFASLRAKRPSSHGAP
jgi:Tfp pilus assembly protein PilF